MPKKIILANFQRIVEVFTQKIFNMLSNIWVWDPRSGIRKKPIPDPGSWIQGSKRHRIPDPDPQHCLKTWHLLTHKNIKGYAQFISISDSHLFCTYSGPSFPLSYGIQ
jgi:hypothetical protein